MRIITTVLIVFVATLLSLAWKIEGAAVVGISSGIVGGIIGG